MVAQDPYGSGWICALTPLLPQGSSGGLRSGDGAAAWLANELRRFREFLSQQVSSDLTLSATCADGGLPVAGSRSQLPPEGWRTFQEEFLSP